jgi:hypothetical protein
VTEPSRKVTPEAMAKIKSDEGDTVELIVELNCEPGDAGAGSSRAERVAAARRVFDAVATGVSERIAELGGEVVDRAWINQTLRSRLPRESVEVLADDDDVLLVDALRELDLDVPHHAERPDTTKEG